MTERLLVVANPNATGSRKVASEVFGPLDDAGISYDTFHTPSPHFDENVEAMQEVFRDGDRIVIAGGDGTASQAVNAMVRRGHTHSELAPLPYGGFVDLSEKRARILEVVGDNVDRQVRYPLAIHVDDELWRYSPGYTTLGFTAVAAASFGSPESRARLKKHSGATKRLAQVAQLGGQYFEHRGDYLPGFHTSTSTSPVVRNAVTDVMLINNARVGGVMRFPIDFGAGNTLGVVERDVSHIIPNIPFGLMALAGRAPSSEQTEHHIHFDDEGPVPIQTEGEFVMLEDIGSLSATKDSSLRYTTVRPQTHRRRSI